MLFDFLLIVVFTFILSFPIMLLAVRSPSGEHEISNQPSLRDDETADGPPPREMEELAELLQQDKGLFVSRESVDIPHIELPGAKLGGGCVNEDCSKATGSFVLELCENPDEQRKYNRRLRDRRTSDQPVTEERRLVQRRIWLRRREDRRGKTLLNVTDAADTLGVTVEQVYKWLDESDIPFYQVTDGKRRAIRFEIDELLQWYGTVVTKGREPYKNT